MPLPAAHFRPVQSAVKTANAKVWGVAAFPAQPLAALPPYGCGVSLAGSDRLVQSHSTAGGHWCTAALPDVSLRGAKRRGNLGEAVAARTSHRRPHALPNLTVAALPAQPLAALPPYGCGVPFTGGDRHAGWHYLRHKFIGARLPNLSFRGAKRRGNLLQSVTFSPRPTCYSTWYCEIATSAAPPRNDKSGSFRIPFQISVYYVLRAVY